ncbi:head-tail adaptor Ad1 [Vibrio phage K394]
MATEFVTLEEIRQQCYLDEFDMSEDRYLTLIGSAAIKHVQNYTNRVLYKSPDDVPVDSENALMWSDDIKMGVLLLIGHFYENRENSSSVKVHDIPFGFHAMIGPYKYIPV